MSDETLATQEIPAEEDELQPDPGAIDPDGAVRATTPRRGAALSVLWWSEGEEPSLSR